MTEVRLSFKLPLDIAQRVNTLRYIVDHLLTLIGVASWRWEFSNGAVKEVIYGPFNKVPPEVFKIHIPTCRMGMPYCTKKDIHDHYPSTIPEEFRR